jgi:hypothetical protein
MHEMIRCLAPMLSVLVLVGCAGTKKVPRPTPSPSPSPSPVPIGVEMRGATWTVRTAGERLLTVSARAAEMEPGRSDGALTARLSGQKATLYRGDRPFLELTGEVSARDDAESVVVMGGRATRLDGSAALRADTIRWERKRRHIVASGDVRLELGGSVFHGKLLTIDDAFTKLTLTQ